MGRAHKLAFYIGKKPSGFYIGTLFSNKPRWKLPIEIWMRTGRPAMETSIFMSVTQFRFPTKLPLTSFDHMWHLGSETLDLHKGITKPKPR